MRDLSQSIDPSYSVNAVAYEDRQAYQSAFSEEMNVVAEMVLVISFKLYIVCLSHVLSRLIISSFACLTFYPA